MKRKIRKVRKVDTKKGDDKTANFVRESALSYADLYFESLLESIQGLKEEVERSRERFNSAVAGERWTARDEVIPVRNIVSSIENCAHHTTRNFNPHVEKAISAVSKLVDAFEIES